MSTVIDSPAFARVPNRIVHVHIPKTAGTAFSDAFRHAYGGRLRVYPERFEVRFSQTNYSDFDFYTAHIGFKLAAEIGGDLITVLRNPVDRFLSTYYFLRQQYNSGSERSHKASLFARFDLDQFVQITDEPILYQELLNRMTWQIAYSHRLELRRDLSATGVDDGDLVRIALSNLRKFAIVGLQEDMPRFTDAVQKRYNVKLSIGRVNVTRIRPAPIGIIPKTLDRLEHWIHLDQELYLSWKNIAVSLDGVPTRSAME